MCPVPLLTSLIACQSHGTLGHGGLSKRRSIQGMLSHACHSPIAQGNHQKSLSPAPPSRCSHALVGGHNVSSVAGEWQPTPPKTQISSGLCSPVESRWQQPPFDSPIARPTLLLLFAESEHRSTLLLGMVSDNRGSYGILQAISLQAA